ncbi:MAG: hypothetical protein JSV03_09970 [Planctomycetota bacterium]|nr:MAG: hypothetical protein JSV03_09970 [Planctomycetota bacterium]
MWKLTLLAVVITVALWWADDGEKQTAKTIEKATPSIFTPAPRLPLLNSDQTYHGVAWQIHHSKDCVEKAGKILSEIADLGADTVLISNAGVQEHAGSETFRIDPEVTPTPQQWQQIFKIAHDNGLRVILMPIVLLSDPRGSEWRGVINPPSWDDWLEQYRKFMLHFARIAADGKVEVLIVGSELVSAKTYVEHWQTIIREVRKVYPGKLSYSGNWDHYKHVEFWDELDLIGMTSYYKLSEDPNPTLKKLIDEWKPIKAGLLRWQKKIGKPLLFTEVGWCSQEGASVEPWNYYHNQNATHAGHQEQRRNYLAFMDTWKDTPEVGGIIWWEWPDSDGGQDDYNYTPKDKPAEGELRRWFQNIRQKSRPATRRTRPTSIPTSVGN